MPPLVKISLLNKNYTTFSALKHVCHFKKQGMTLVPSLPETTRPLLVYKLDKTERRLEAVGKNNLDIALVEC